MADLATPALFTQAMMGGYRTGLASELIRCK